MSRKNPFADLESLRREDDMGGQQSVQEAAKLEQEAPKSRTKWRREFVQVPWEWAERLQAAKPIKARATVEGGARGDHRGGARAQP
jgi:hypothetical protein